MKENYKIGFKVHYAITKVGLSGVSSLFQGLKPAILGKLKKMGEL